MVKICGTIKKSVRAETRENPGLFEVRLLDQIVLCRGHLFPVSRRLPLSFYGEWSDDGIFNVQRTNADFWNESGMVRFLSGAAFTDIGSLRAARIYRDLLAKTKDGKLTKESVTAVFSDHQVPLMAGRFYDALTGIQKRTKLYELLKKADGTWLDVEALYGPLGETAFPAIAQSPYLGVKYGVPFPVCDRLARLQGTYKERDRMDALCRYLAMKILRDGSSCMELARALSFMRYVLSSSRSEPESYLLSVLLASTGFIIRMKEEDGTSVPVVCPSSLLTREEEIATMVLSLDKEETASDITEWDEEGLDPDQKKALRGVLQRPGVSIVTGAPGAGKTTLIKRILSTYQQKFPKKEIRIAAPTGRAAARISESFGEDEAIKAVTVHRMIGAKPYTDDTAQYMYNSARKLPEGLYVIDEASMLDEHITHAFLSAVTKGSYVIFTGDPGQLLSVDTGSVLQDMILSGTLRTYHLTRMHRQSERSLIAENYRKIVKKNTHLSEGPDFHIIRCESDREIKDTAIRLYEKYGSGSPYGFEILTCVRKGDTGKDGINQEILERRHRTRVKYAPGDRIMMTANDYEKGYMNGDIGEVLKVRDDSLLVRFYDGIKELDKGCFPDMDYAFACTIHKAQGSEYDRTAVILDDSADVMLKNRLILTAVTRAKKECFVISKGDALERAILHADAGERCTLLRDLLKEKEGHS